MKSRWPLTVLAVVLVLGFLALAIALDDPRPPAERHNGRKPPRDRAAPYLTKDRSAVR
jgi:hypothetical protein